MGVYNPAMTRRSRAALATATTTCLMTVLIGCDRSKPTADRARVVVDAQASAAGSTKAPSPSTLASAPGITQDDADRILEAIFRYQYDHNASGQQKNAEVICLMAFGGDPPDAVMRALSSEPKFAKLSTCTHGPESERVTQPATGKRGYILQVGGMVKKTSESTLEIEGGYYEAPESASGNIYFVERSAGKWKVVRDTRLWIS